MSESFESKLMRWKFNFFPAYRASGARLTYVSSDFLEMRMKLRLTRATRNYVGTLFGGSMYASVDPIYMMILIKVLGPEYVVWDKAATIRFKKPGKTTLCARFIIDKSELAVIKSELNTQHSIDRIYNVDLTDEAGVIHASVEKVVYIRRKDHGKQNMIRQV